MPDSATKPRLTRTVTLAMAVSSGAAVANLYYNQPILGLIAHQLPGGARLAGLIPTATQTGYAAGMLLLVPLGDTLDRRKLILWQTLALAMALAVAALAPDARALILASLAVGLTATIAQMIVPFAAELAAPGERGAVVGTVMSGVLAGILLGRALAGVVAEQAGWRAIFWLGSGVALLIAGLLGRLLPRSGPGRAIRYGALLASLLALLREEPALRRASLVQAAQFAAFNAFWTTLAFRLQAPPLHLGAGVAGAFGVLGATGVLVAPVVGRAADRRGPQPIIRLGILCVLLAWGVFVALPGLPGLILGVVLLDLGVQASLIANQAVVYALRPPARNRINTLFVGIMFAGGALGSAGAGVAWRHGGWHWLCAFGVMLGVLALAFDRLGRRNR